MDASLCHSFLAGWHCVFLAIAVGVWTSGWFLHPGKQPWGVCRDFLWVPQHDGMGGPSPEILLCKKWKVCQAQGWKGKLGPCSKASPSPCPFILDFPSEGVMARVQGWWGSVPAAGSASCVAVLVFI